MFESYLIVLESFLIIFKSLDFPKIVFRQKLIKNDAREAWDPSRKMRLERLVRESAGINSIRPLWWELLAILLKRTSTGSFYQSILVEIQVKSM